MPRVSLSRLGGLPVWTLAGGRRLGWLRDWSLTKSEALTLTAPVLVSAVADAEWAAGRKPVLHGWPRLCVPGQRQIDHQGSR